MTFAHYTSSLPTRSARQLPIARPWAGFQPSSSSLASTCFKANKGQDFGYTGQAKSWYNKKSYGAIRPVNS